MWRRGAEPYKRTVSTAEDRLARAVERFAASRLAAFFDADLARLGAFDLAAGSKPLVAKYTQCLDLGALAAAFAVLEYLDVARTRHTVFGRYVLLGWQGPPKDQQLADVLDRRGIEFVCQCVKNGFAGGPVVRQNSYLDQAMGIQTCFDFLFDGGGQSVGANHDDRVEMVG